MVPNAPKFYEMHIFYSRMGSIGCVRCEKFRHDFVARTLHHYDRFGPSFVTQLNGPQCTKIVWNASTYEFRVQWGGSGAFVSKNFDATLWHELLDQFGLFCTESRESTKQSQMHQNCMKCTKTWVLGSNGVEWVRSLRTIPTPLRGTNFCTSSARFAPSFVTRPKGHKCTQILWNATKHEFRVQWGLSRALVAKHSDAASWLELLHQFCPFCTEFRNSTKRSECHKIIRNAPQYQFRVQ